MVDSYTGLTVFVTIWLGGAVIFGGLGWVIWGDRRMWLLTGLWLFPVGCFVAGQISLWVLEL